MRDLAKTRIDVANPTAHWSLWIDDVPLNELVFPENIVVSYKKSFADELPEAGQRFLLYPRFSDFNTDRIVTYGCGGYSR